MIFSIRHLPDVIPIGVQTEQGVEPIGFDLRPWLDAYDGMTVSIWPTRPGETAAYPAADTEIVGSILYWYPNTADTAKAGSGTVELLGLTGDKRKLSGVCKTEIEASSLGSTQEPPEAARPWVDEVLGAADRAEEQADRAQKIADGLIFAEISGAVRYDQAQTLTEEQKAQARRNIGAGTGDGSGAAVEIDATLTKAGAAADAKAVGDELTALSQEMAGMGAIIDLTVLPETGEKKQLYRLLTGTFYWNGDAFSAYTCEIVDTLPETGEPATNADMSTVYMYYSLETKAVMGYIPADLGAGLGIPAGWYPAEQLFPVADIAYGGVVLSPLDASADNTMYVVLEGTLYEYSDRWVALNQVGWRGDGNSAEIFNSLQNVANGNFSHAEGFRTIAGNIGSHAEGYYSHAEGYYSHAEGYYSHAEGDSSHAEGYYSHAEGRGAHFALNLTGDSNATTYSSVSSLPSNMYVGMIARMRRYGENAGNEVGVTYSTAKVVSFDTDTKTITFNRTLSDIAVSDAYTIFYYAGMALGNNSHVEGYQNIAAGRSQHVEGEFNIQDPEYNADNKDARGKYVHVVGNGTSHTNRSNAHTLDWDGNAWFAGGIELTSPNGTRYRFTVSDDGTLTAKVVTE